MRGALVGEPDECMVAALLCVQVIFEDIVMSEFVILFAPAILLSFLQQIF